MPLPSRFVGLVHYFRRDSNCQFCTWLLLYDRSLCCLLADLTIAFHSARVLDGIIAGALIVGLIGIIMEILVLRRIYRAPGLFQIVATFAVILIVQDLVQKIWGPDEIFSPPAPGLRGVVEIAGQLFPEYDLALIAIGPLVLAFIC